MENEGQSNQQPKPTEVKPLDAENKSTGQEKKPDVTAALAGQGFKIGPDGSVMSPAEVDDYDKNK